MEPFFPKKKKKKFALIWARRAPNDPKLGDLFYFWKNLSLVFPGNNLNWKLNQITGFFKIECLKKEVKDEMYFWHADKHQFSTSWYYYFGYA